MYIYNFGSHVMSRCYFACDDAISTDWRNLIHNRIRSDKALKHVYPSILGGVDGSAVLRTKVEKRTHALRRRKLWTIESKDWYGATNPVSRRTGVDSSDKGVCSSAKTGRWKELGVPRDDPSQPQLPKLEMGLLVIAPFDCPYKDSVLLSSTASVIFS